MFVLLSRTTGNSRREVTPAHALSVAISLPVVEKKSPYIFQKCFCLFKTFTEQIKISCNSILCLFILLNFHFRCTCSVQRIVFMMALV